MYEIKLPRQLNKNSIRDVIISFRNYVDSCVTGSEITIDMRGITFIEPAGVIALSNIIQWARKNKNVHVNFIIDTSSKDSRNIKAMEYLSDCSFFANFDQADIFKVPRLRQTTLELKEVGTTKIDQWKQSDLMTWLQSRTGRINEFSSICVAIDEIFNNISDHSQEHIGSIFGQHYPNRDRIIIAVSDFGIGIPASIKRKFELDLPDNKLIEHALEEGISSQSVPQNRGAGLSNIMKTLTRNNIGEVTIVSNCGKVVIIDNKVVESTSFEESYPGTFFELIIDVSNEHLYDLEEEEEFEW